MRINVPRFNKLPIDTSVYGQMISLSKLRAPNNSIEGIRQAVWRATEIDPYMNTRLRDARYVKSRHLFFYFVRMYSGLSQTDTGRLLGKDHATVNIALKCVEEHRAKEPDYKRIFELIEERVRHYFKVKSYETKD
jgi:chromosomal replication initiation ATPase DnaA